MEHPSRAGSAFGRRGLLRLAALAPAAAALTTACSSSQKAPDQLEALASDARSDAALARAVAGAHPDLAEKASAVATTRSAHAEALRREVERVNPPDPEQPQPAPPKVDAPASSAQATQAMSEGLRGAQAKAARLVPGLPAYRAGLTGSISASCAGLLEVLA